jgi:hypothetical protein
LIAGVIISISPHSALRLIPDRDDRPARNHTEDELERGITNTGPN